MDVLICFEDIDIILVDEDEEVEKSKESKKIKEKLRGSI